MKKLILIMLAVLTASVVAAKLPIIEPYTYNGVPAVYDQVQRIVYNFNATTVLSNITVDDNDSIYREELTVDSCGTYKVVLIFHGNGQRVAVSKEIVSNCYGKGLGNPMIVDLDAATGTLSDAQVDNITVTAGTVSDKTGYALSGTQVFNNTGTWAGNITGNLSGSVGSVSGNVGGNVAGSVASVSGNVGGNVAGSVNSVTSAVTIGAVNSGSIDSADFSPSGHSFIRRVDLDYMSGTLDSVETGLTFRKMIAIRADSGRTIDLTDENIDSIVAGVVDAGIAIDTAAFRANLQATPMIVGTNNDKTNYFLGSAALTSGVFANSGLHVIALASDSGGVVAVDYNVIASTAYDYFTAGSREDPFKGGAGAGPDTTLIYVLSATDSTPIVGASVSYFVGATKLATNTDSTGLVVFGATAGTYTAIAEAKPRYMSTVSITAGTVDTMFMTQPTIPDPVDTNLTGAYGYIYDLNGDPVQGAIVSVRNQGRDLQVGNLIISHYEVYDTTDAAGFWSMNLYPTATLGDTTTYRYTFTLFRASQQIVRKQNIVVPDVASWQFDF